MLCLGEDKLNTLLASRGMTLSGLARDCGVSRQSIYDMLGKKSVFNSTFVKILSHLGVDYEQLTETHDVALLRTMPVRIQKAVMRLISFCEAHQAGLLLFGSRARGKTGIGADWDFGVYSLKPFGLRPVNWRLDLQK
jgi:transcriptional regulator with XRE-family HTH domain